jgi:hypothetical protein
VGGIRSAALKAAELYEDLGEVLEQPKQQTERVTTSQSYGINLNDEVMEARSHILHLLGQWVQLILEETGCEFPKDTPANRARLIGVYEKLLRSMGLHDECLGELQALYNPAYLRLAYPARTTVIFIADCECGGKYRYETSAYAESKYAICSGCHNPKPVTEFTQAEQVSIPEAAHVASFHAGIMVSQDAIRGMVRRGKLVVVDGKIFTADIANLYQKVAA